MDDQPPRIFKYYSNITNEDILALKEENKTLGHHPENVLIKKGKKKYYCTKIRKKKDRQRLWDFVDSGIKSKKLKIKT